MRNFGCGAGVHWVSDCKRLVCGKESRSVVRGILLVEANDGVLEAVRVATLFRCDTCMTDFILRKSAPMRGDAQLVIELLVFE